MMYDTVKMILLDSSFERIPPSLLSESLGGLCSEFNEEGRAFFEKHDIRFLNASRFSLYTSLVLFRNSFSKRPVRFLVDCENFKQMRRARKETSLLFRFFGTNDVYSKFFSSKAYHQLSILGTSSKFWEGPGFFLDV